MLNSVELNITQLVSSKIFSGDNEFICDNGDILEVSRKCNGYPDCPNGEDEQNCIYNEDLNGGKEYLCLEFWSWDPICF